MERWEDSEYTPTNKKQLKAFQKAQNETKTSTMWTGVGMGLMAGIALAAMPAAVLGVATTAGVTIAGMAIGGGVISGLATLASVAIAAGATYVGWKAGEKMGESAAKNLKPAKPTMDDIISAEDKKVATQELLVERAAEFANTFRKSLNRQISEGSFTLEEKESVLEYLANMDMGNKQQNTFLKMMNDNLAAELARTTQELDASFVTERDKKRAEIEGKVEEVQAERTLAQLKAMQQGDQKDAVIEKLTKAGEQLGEKVLEQKQTIDELKSALQEMRRDYTALMEAARPQRK